MMMQCAPFETRSLVPQLPPKMNPIVEGKLELYMLIMKQLEDKRKVLEEAVSTAESSHPKCDPSRKLNWRSSVDSSL